MKIEYSDDENCYLDDMSSDNENYYHKYVIDADIYDYNDDNNAKGLNN